MEKMQITPPHGRCGLGAIDLMLWSALVVLAMAASYHPYYFGDEISPLREAAQAGRFLDALRDISAYKPRLVFNAIWAAGGLHDWPRWYFGAINAGCIIAIGACCAHVAGRWFGASRLQLWLLLGVIGLSRFSAMVYFDYVSGIIETASMAALMATVLAAAKAWDRPDWIWGTLAVLLGTTAVLVHERYMAATFALGCVVALAGLYGPSPRRGLRSLIALGIALVPVVTFLGLVQWLESLPVTTGTSGQEVMINLGTLKVFCMYLGNIFLGLNFGKDWFVGTLNMGSAAGLWLGLAAAAVFTVGWAWYLLSLRTDRRARLYALAGMMLIGALTVMASLPGEGRQEARWMYPVGTLVALLVFCNGRAAVRYGLLGAMLLLAAIHWGNGALDATANVYVSRTAAHLGAGVNGLVPQGRKAVLIGLGDNPWEVGGRNGVDEFARRNFNIPLRVRIHDPNEPGLVDWADLGIVRAGGDEHSGYRFASLEGDALRLLLDPESIRVDEVMARNVRVLAGGDTGWEGWKWSRPPQRRGQDIVLESASRLVGFIDLPASVLDGRWVVYRASLSDPSAATAGMRLQVNWMGADNAFLGASIEVVQVQATATDFTMRLTAPSGAERGLVYANLHDGQDGLVVLESISLHQQDGMALGRGADWRDWRWQGPATIDAQGVRIGKGGTEAGFREIDASLLDNHLLVYRARLAGPGTDRSSMRLQVNWLDAGQQFLGASIEVVSVQARSRNYPMLVVAPPGAARGLVYANLHRPDEADVMLESVDVMGTR